MVNPPVKGNNTDPPEVTDHYDHPSGGGGRQAYKPLEGKIHSPLKGGTAFRVYLTPDTSGGTL